MPGLTMSPGMEWHQAMAVLLRTPSLRLILCRIGLCSSHCEFTYLPFEVLLSFSHSEHKTGFWQRGLSTLFIVRGRYDQLWHRRLGEFL